MPLNKVFLRPQNWSTKALLLKHDYRRQGVRDRFPPILFRTCFRNEPFIMNVLGSRGTNVHLSNVHFFHAGYLCIAVPFLRLVRAHFNALSVEAIERSGGKRGMEG